MSRVHKIRLGVHFDSISCENSTLHYRTAGMYCKKFL